MALIHSLKNTLVNQPIAVVLLIVLIYASFFRTLIVTASSGLFKYPVLRRVYFSPRQAFLTFHFCSIIKEQIPVILISATELLYHRNRRRRLILLSGHRNSSRSAVLITDWWWNEHKCCTVGLSGCAMNMMRIFISDCQVWGWCSHQWRLEMTLADFNLRRAALFATRIFVLTQMAFPRVNKEISRRKSRWKLTISTRLRSQRIYIL